MTEFTSQPIRSFDSGDADLVMFGDEQTDAFVLENNDVAGPQWAITATPPEFDGTSTMKENTDVLGVAFNPSSFMCGGADVPSPLIFHDDENSQAADDEEDDDDETVEYCGHSAATDVWDVGSMMDQLNIPECTESRPNNADKETASAYMERTMRYVDPFFTADEWESAFDEAMSVYRTVPLSKGERNRCRPVWRNVVSKCNEVVGNGLHRAAVSGSQNGLNPEITQKMLALQCLLRNLPHERALILGQALMLCAAMGESDPHRKRFS